MPGLAGEVVGAVHVAVSDRLHRGGHDGQAGAPGPGRVQPHRGLRHVPRRGHHLPLLLGRQVTHSQNLSRLPFDCLYSTYLFFPQEREPEAAAVPGPQRQREVDGALTHPGSLPLLLGRLQVRLQPFRLKIVFV